MKATPTAIALFAATTLSASAAEPAPNGIPLPEGYKDWRLHSVHQRSDNTTLRAVLGNDIAVKAAREGQTNPWPTGTILAKLAFKGVQHEKFPTAMEPGDFVHAELMIKDAEEYAATRG